MPDDGGVDEDIEEVRDAPHSVWNHGLQPTRDDERDKSIERKDTKRK